MATSYQKDVKRIRKLAEEQGWREKPKNCGWLLLSPDDETKVMIHKTATCAHARDNLLSELRKGGFVWEDR
jgi:predicted HTH transcriptional regulator